MPPTNTPSNPPKPTTFSDLLPVTQQTSHTYTVDLQDSFCIGTVPNGGYITSAFLLAARKHMEATHGAINCSDPINVHLEFLRRTAAGPATFSVRDVKLGRRISNLHLTLRQHCDPQDATTPLQDEVEGYITLTDLSRESGPSQDTKYTLLPPPLPADLAALSRNIDEKYIRRRPDPYGAFRRASLHCDMYLVRPSRRPADSSLAIADQWVRFRPLDPSSSADRPGETLAAALKAGSLHRVEGRWTNDALGYLVDIFPQINERYTNTAVEDAVLSDPADISDAQIQELIRGTKTQFQSQQQQQQHSTTNNNNNKGESAPAAAAAATAAPSRTFWYPTLLLNLDVKKLLPPAGVEWLFVRVQAKKIDKGRFDLHVEVWDDGGDLVALSTHASLILDASRNVQRSGGKKSNNDNNNSNSSKSKSKM